MSRHELVNALAAEHRRRTGLPQDQQRYLEIGVDEGRTIRLVTIGQKEGVDPMPKFAGAQNCEIHKLTSDEFFANRLPGDARYHVIFVDGLHLREFVWRDIRNSLALLAPNGFIAIDDLLPHAASEQTREPSLVHPSWTGDVWHAWYALMRIPQFRDRGAAVKVCCGVGFLDAGTNPAELADLMPSEVPEPNVAWEEYHAQDVRHANAISWADFKSRYPPPGPR